MTEFFYTSWDEAFRYAVAESVGLYVPDELYNEQSEEIERVARSHGFRRIDEDGHIAFVLVH